jgi:hypothetical protein
MFFLSLSRYMLGEYPKIGHHWFVPLSLNSSIIIILPFDIMQSLQFEKKHY